MQFLLGGFPILPASLACRKGFALEFDTRPHIRDACAPNPVHVVLQPAAKPRAVLRSPSKFQDEPETLACSVEMRSADALSHACPRYVHQDYQRS